MSGVAVGTVEEAVGWEEEWRVSADLARRTVSSAVGTGEGERVQERPLLRLWRLRWLEKTLVGKAGLLVLPDDEVAFRKREIPSDGRERSLAW